MPISPEQTLIAGDIVTVQAIVQGSTRPGDSQIFVSFGSIYGSGHHVDRNLAELVTTKISVGDEVGYGESSLTRGIVVAIVDDQAWVKWPNGPMVVEHSVLHRTRTQREVLDAAARDAAAPVLQAAE